MTSNGTVTIHVAWVGIGQAPSKTVIKITSESSGLALGESPGVVVDNGLGSLPVGPNLNLFTTSSGYRYRTVDIPTNHGETTIHVSATAFSSGQQAMVATNAGNPYATIADLAIGLVEFSRPNYNAVPGLYPLDFPSLNMNPDPTELLLDVAASEYYESEHPVPLLKYSTPVLPPAFFGTWPSEEYRTIALSHMIWLIYGGQTDLSQLNSTYTREQVIEMIKGNFDSQTMMIDGYDHMSDQSRSGSITLRIHSPFEKAAFGPFRPVFGNFEPASARVHLTPGQRVKANISHGVVHTVAAEVAFDSTTSISSDFRDLFVIAVDVTEAVKRNETASISQGNDYEFEFNNPSGVAVVKWIEKQGFHKERDVFSRKFGSSGFEGMVHAIETTFKSSTKELAESQDYGLFYREEPEGY